MDVTDKKSILQGVNLIEEKEGKLHILVNKSVPRLSSSVAILTISAHYSAGQVGPVSGFFNDMSAPQHKDPGALGRALFENESFEEWSDLYRINTFSIFFVTTAFLGLLAKGAEDHQVLKASVVNITSISAIMRLAQCHVKLLFSQKTNILTPLTWAVCIQQREGGLFSLDSNDGD